MQEIPKSYRRQRKAAADKMYPRPKPLRRGNVVIFGVLLGQCLCRPTLGLPLRLSPNESVIQFCKEATEVKIPPPACLNSTSPVRILYYHKEYNNIVASYDFGRHKSSVKSTASYDIADDFSLIVKTPKTNDSFSSECYYTMDDYTNDGNVREGPIMLKEYKPSHEIINMTVGLYESNEKNATCESSTCEISVAKGSEVRLKCALLGFNSTADSPGIFFNWTNTEEKWIPRVPDHRNEGESASVVTYSAEKDNNITCSMYVHAECGGPNLKKFKFVITVCPDRYVDMSTSNAVNYTSYIVLAFFAVVISILVVIVFFKRKEIQNKWCAHRAKLQFCDDSQISEETQI